MPALYKNHAPIETASIKHLKRGFGPYMALLFSDSAALTQFGAFTETLPPGSRSGPAHWHENEDEFIYVLSGLVDLHEGDQVTTLTPGDAAAFKAGVPIGHHLINTSNQDTTYLVVGTRAKIDVAHLTDEDAILTRNGSEKTWTNRAGTPITR